MIFGKKDGREAAFLFILFTLVGGEPDPVIFNGKGIRQKIPRFSVSAFRQTGTQAAAFDVKIKPCPS